MSTLNHGRRHLPRPGYTLLELMLALGLMSALMTVAWSLMETFRSAELRGWKLAHRTQTIRTARAWLTDDIQHIVQGNSSTNTPPRFSGNAMGFSTTLAPSMDPIPFLEKLMSDPRDEVIDEPELTSADLVGGMTEFSIPASLWPEERIEVTYELSPMELTSDDQSVSNPLMIDPESIQYSLMRRESYEAGAAPATRNASSNLTQSSNLADRVLTAKDLYRQTDESSLAVGPTLRETQLSGLTKAQFQYFDGQAWTSQWNSQSSGRLPVAIALCFDFPPTSMIKQPEVKPRSTSELNDPLSDPSNALDRDALSFADAALASEPLATNNTSGETSLMQASTHEVQIIVFIASASQGAAATPSSPSRTRNLRRSAP